jgi:hypothetical protein
MTPADRSDFPTLSLSTAQPEPLSAYVRRTGTTESDQGWIADRIAEIEAERDAMFVTRNDAFRAANQINELLTASEAPESPQEAPEGPWIYQRGESLDFWLVKP